MTGTAADAPVWHFVDDHGERVQPPDYPVARVLRTRLPLPPQTSRRLRQPRPNPLDGMDQACILASRSPIT